MQKLTNNFKSWLALSVIAVGLILPATNAEARWSWWNRHRVQPNLVEKLERTGNHTTLLTALELTGLKETVETAEALTLFAPTDNAFAALPEGALEDLVNDTDTLTQILLYHVVGGKQSTAQMLQETIVTTLQGNPVLVTYDNWQPTVNGNTIHPANLRASNGYIQSIDQILLPPEEPVELANILDVLRFDGRFTILITALEETGLDDAIADSPDLTVFAPTDEAFLALPEGTIPALLDDLDTLSNILLYHVLGQSVDALAAIRAGSAPTLQGDEVNISWENWKIFVNDSKVIAPNVRAPNGIIHTLDAVLLPPAAPEESDDLLGVLKADGRFNTLIAALEATGLDAALAGEDPLTIFAPTDDAFDRLPAGTVESLLVDLDALTDILLYHVVGGDRDLHSLRNERSVETLNGSNVHLWNWRKYFFVNRSYIQEADTLAANGRLHVINRVLIP